MRYGHGRGGGPGGGRGEGPGSRGAGGGRGDGRGSMLEPALLVALAGETSHGYDLRSSV